MLILSTRDPTVSAIFSPGALPPDRLQHGLVDPLDQVVSRLIQSIDVPLGGGNLMVIRDACLILFMPELDVRRRELRDEGTDAFVHRPEPPSHRTCRHRWMA